ncbi:hypothetical protein HBE96_12440 [Clostridium sp. P21]|uniref:Uncharacterized protein n=1 Tax=Clostridium muellerianum TaxID=2716538 RepID=A0A7Y0HP86_9CLOT|nr:hypothetical protein [Clostridium muellerianum]NMM63467.1 hypothetical protein [Clostridium muellerianum]
MAQYQMNINGNIQLMDYSSIYDYMSIVDKCDNLTINFIEGETEDIDILCKMLEDNSFMIRRDKHYDKGEYHISAIKY